MSRSYGFEDSPDAEVLVKGLNFGKEYGAVAIGRHGNFLQWGYAAPPSGMTEDGRRLFLNCIHYIRKFEGRSPLVRRVNSDRMNALRLAALIDEIDDKSFFSSTFSPEQMKKYEGNPAGLVKYYQGDYELIYREKVFLVDEELKSVGINSNRRVDSLEQLIKLLEKGENERLVRNLLERYTEQSFTAAGQWREWFEKVKDRLYFSDVGGYKFRVIPEGYLD